MVKLDLFGLGKKENKQLNPAVAIKQSTKYERTFETSPIFQFSNSSTVASEAELLIDFETEKPNTGKYLPFNTLRILNNSDEDIDIYINQKRNRPIRIPAGTIQPIDKTIAPAISSILIKNRSTTGTISAEELQVIVSRDNVDTDAIAKSIHKLLYKQGA